MLKECDTVKPSGRLDWGCVVLLWTYHRRTRSSSFTCVQLTTPLQVFFDWQEWHHCLYTNSSPEHSKLNQHCKMLIFTWMYWRKALISQNLDNLLIWILSSTVGVLKGDILYILRQYFILIESFQISINCGWIHIVNHLFYMTPRNLINHFSPFFHSLTWTHKPALLNWKP